MGYTHYWYTPRKLDPVRFQRLVNDCTKIVNYSTASLGITLANAFGDPDTLPELNTDSIAFNGSDKQPIGVWTTDEEVSIPGWCNAFECIATI